MAVHDLGKCPIPTPPEELHEVKDSISLLLGKDTGPVTTISTIKHTSARTPTAILLETRTHAILRAFNTRDVAAPYALHATPDFTFVHEDHRGEPKTMAKTQAMYWMRHEILRNIEHYAEVMSSAVEVDEKKGLAVVWLGIRIHDRPDGFMPGREKVTMFFWRRVEGVGGEVRWMWWRHVCLSARMPFPR